MLSFNNSKKTEITISSSKQIAIVGLAAKLNAADNYQQFWENLCQGKDCIGELPGIREADILDCLRCLGKTTEDIKFRTGAYFERIDEFDYSFFRITRKEASLMDPNQRLFLQTAWQAIEDAGYAPESLSGSRIGVYVGYSSNNDYQQLIAQISPQDIVMSEAGNINSIIASRISYILNLRGPSMVVDTACSSALTAVHLACQAIQNGEIDGAIVGGCKIWLMPQELKERLGIESSTGRAKTFDDEADGTGFGEGVFAVMLKPLGKAVNDHNHIYATIEQTGLNQDGASMGITAPNMMAQEQLLTSVWKKTGINPEKISYIEAHGTGTKLGDPIEVNAISNAFSKFTNKKQFCGIGSVKTNIGHLDGAAGMAGFMKTVLALYNKKIPASLHFKTPNRRIDFNNSAVYVNSRLQNWDDEERYAGVSAFGLSGTNCHVLLKSYNNPDGNVQMDSSERYVLPLSAKTLRSLTETANKYSAYIRDTKSSLEDICYTASAGRSHYNFRAVFTAKDRRELAEKLMDFANDVRMDRERGIYYGYYILASQNKEQLEASEVYEEEINHLTREAEAIDSDRITDELIDLYIRGAEINWEKYYREKFCNRVSLPVYSFERERCWISNVVDMHSPDSLLGEKIEEDDKHILYSKIFNTGEWFLKEHRIFQNYIAPGTVFIEIIHLLQAENKLEDYSISDLFFMNPLIVDEKQNLEVKLEINKQKEGYSFTAYSDANGKKVHYSKCTLSRMIQKPGRKMDINALLQECTQHYEAPSDGMEGLEFGDRWNTIRKEIHSSERFYLARLSMAEKFQNDVKAYAFHPSLLDMAINAITQMTGFGVFLPYGYEELELYKPLPAECYSYIEVKQQSRNNDVITFDISILDLSGEILISAHNYVIKRIDAGSLNNVRHLFDVKWVEDDRVYEETDISSGNVLIFENEETSGYLDNIPAARVNISNGAIYRRTGVEGNDSVKWNYEVLESILVNELNHGIHSIVISAPLSCGRDDTMKAIREQELYADLLRYIVQILHRQNYQSDINIYVFTRNAFNIDHCETYTNHASAALLALGCVVNQESRKIHFCGIDLDDDMLLQGHVSQYILKNDRMITAYRKGKMYEEVVCPYQRKSRLSYQYSDDGVYVITGGDGEIGRRLAFRIAEKAKAHIVLIGRRIHEKEKGDQEFADIIREIRAKGSTVELLQCDVTEENQVGRTFEHIIQIHQKITGVYHLAGVAGKGYLFDKTDEQFEKVVSPKVDGTVFVDKYSRGHGRQFLVLFSSVSSIYRAAGEGDYVFANAFMDSFANECDDILSINWAAFKECGMAKRMNKEDDQIFYMLTNQEAFEALEVLSAEGQGNIIAGKLNQGQLEKNADKIWIRVDESIDRKEAVNAKTKERSREENKEGNKEIKEENAGKIVTQIWEQVLGISPIDVYKDFQAYGGDSITATAIYGELKKYYGQIVDIESIFSYPSVAEMTEYIMGKIAENTKSDANDKEMSLDDILQEVNRNTMTVDDAITLIWGGK